jgi:hypothetical protein
MYLDFKVNSVVPQSFVLFMLLNTFIIYRTWDSYAEGLQSGMSCDFYGVVNTVHQKSTWRSLLISNFYWAGVCGHLVLFFCFEKGEASNFLLTKLWSMVPSNYTSIHDHVCICILFNGVISCYNNVTSVVDGWNVSIRACEWNYTNRGKLIWKNFSRCHFVESDMDRRA